MTNAPATVSESLKPIRTALALNRAMELFETLKAEGQKTAEHDESKRVEYLTSLFMIIHRSIHQDWKDQGSAPHQPGVTQGEIYELRDAIKSVLCSNGNGVEHGEAHTSRFVMALQAFRRLLPKGHDDGHHKAKGLFDTHGFAVRHNPRQLAEIYAAFYHRMQNPDDSSHKLRIFDYGNGITLDCFIVAMSKLRAVKAVYPHEVDFRRLSAADTAIIHDPGSTVKQLTGVFLHALDPARNRQLPNDENGFTKWESKAYYIKGIPFLSHVAADGTPCLVTMNGGLVPIEKIQAQLTEDIISKKHFTYYQHVADSELIGQLPGTEELRTKSEIDGIPIEPGSAPLCCIDMNILTGLRGTNQEALETLIKSKKQTLFYLANNPKFRDELTAAAGNDEKLKQGIEIAYRHLSKATDKLDTLKQKFFNGKMPVQHPQLFMSMGGAGVGKSSVKDVAHAHCGNNFVTASLDDFRYESDFHKLLVAAGHHGDDYGMIEPFASALRSWVAAHAREKHYSLLYDGTGVDYQPRYRDMVREFRHARYTVQVVAVDAPLEVAIQRVKSRFAEEKRALPWKVVLGKHISMPLSFLQTLEDPNVAKTSLFANDRGKGEQYLVAETFMLSSEELGIVQAHQQSGNLAAHFKAAMAHDKHSTLRGIDSEHVEALIEKIPHFDEKNVSYLAYPMEGGRERVLAVYNTERFQDLMEKSFMNPEASNEKGLLHLPDTVTFRMDSKAHEPWRLRLRNSMQSSAPGIH